MRIHILSLTLFSALLASSPFTFAQENIPLDGPGKSVNPSAPSPTTPAREANTNPRPGKGPGQGRGPDPEMRADQDVFHFLLEHHDKIRRNVKNLPNGVESLTESDDDKVAAKIQEHVASMHTRVKNGRGLRFWDELFVQIFRHYDKIEMTVENTDHGVRVRETSSDPYVASLIQAHAQVVSLFVKHGFDEAHKEHRVPTQPASTNATDNKTSEASKLVYPLIDKYGGVRPRPGAAEAPRAGAKVVFDITVDTKPSEVNKGLDRVARLRNLYGSSDLQASDVKIVVALHGESTRAVLTDAAYKARHEVDQNPNLPLIRLLRKAGVEIYVCGQALNYKNIPDNEVADNIPIASAALTVVINKQNDGYAYLPVP